ncbi:MAG: amidohydrolase family protein [Myxococcaceae bacterium]
MGATLATFVLLLVPSWMGTKIQAPETSRRPQTTLAIVRATVIDGIGNGGRADTTVVIVGDRIVTVGSAGATKVPPGAQVVDARGKYLIPGLWDMHVHLSKVGPGVLPILVAAGVTDVRDLGGDLVELRLWRDEIAEGLRLGPRIILAGPILDGRRGADFHVAVMNAPEARAAVRELVDLGVDFIKVHVSLSRDAYFAIAEEARRSGLRFVGHIPGPVSAGEASDAGQAMIEHTESLLAAELHPKTDAELVEQTEAYPADRARKLFEHFVRNGTAFDPTLIEYWVWAYADDPSIRTDPRRDIASRELKATWVRMGGDDPGWKQTGERKHRGKELGTIEPGKLADLVILSRDPLDDIGNITSTEAVILRGRLIDAAERKCLLEDARRAATAQ